jgi:PHS family inorganic phosphate transporter-like MFS transporter
MSRAFKKLDEIEFSWFYVKLIIISGAGFFTDAYDLFSISLCTAVLGRIYYQDNPFNLGNTVSPGSLPIGPNAAVTSVALVGTLVGQFFFGYVGDKFGRKSAYALCLSIMIFAALAQSMSFGTSPNAVIGTLCFWRFILGFGVGGDYPISATIMSEFSNKKNRGAYIGSVFAMQGIGYLVASGVTAIVAASLDAAYPSARFPIVPVGCKSWTALAAPNSGSCPLFAQQAYYAQVLASCPPEVDFSWRIILAVGCFPGICTIYMRSKISESPRYTVQVEKKSDRAEKDIEAILRGDAVIDHSPILAVKTTGNEMTFGQFIWQYKWQMLGTTMCWFLLDIAFYSQTLFQSQVFLQVGFLPPSKEMYALQQMANTAKAQALIALGSIIPGYWATVFTVDYLGRWFIQMMGFTMTTALMVALCTTYFDLLNPNTPSDKYLSDLQPNARNGWIAMYSLCFFFMNFGPNSTTFIYPAELYPTAWKSTGHGISAACGKAGAIIGAFGFLYAAQPAEGESTWAFPCQGAVYQTPANYIIRKSDLDATGGCIRKLNCPTGRTDDGNGHCNCTPNALSGCYPFGIGIQGALGVLAATNFLGMLFTFLLPETNQKSLEELQGLTEHDKDEVKVIDNPGTML